jgi:hypothetical protein
MTPELYHPVLDCFLRGLPHAFRDVRAPSGTTIQVEISGDCGGRWTLAKGPLTWALVRKPQHEFASRVTIPQALAWRLFTKGIDPGSVQTQITIEGDPFLGERVLHLTAIVA